ncbi:MAG: hypothetical protein KDJ90_15810 [Nitratireductor sp.]|nr:hypothetical protein [Nitratireductor sp.]
MSEKRNGKSCGDPDNLLHRARCIVRQRIARASSAGQLQAIVYATTGELLEFGVPDDLRRVPRDLSERVTAKLERALARERGRARSGHRSYDFNRHLALHQALLALRETAASQRN